MKRILFALVAFFTMANLYASGYVTIDGLRYFINTDEQTATLVAKDSGKYEGDIVVPEKVSLDGVDYPVVAFGGNCFSDCRELESIIIPNSVETLRNSCFKGCSSLSSISLPSSITSLGDACFNGCSSLSSVSLPSSITSLGSSTFEGCSSLTSISLPSSITSIGYNCFRGAGLRGIEIPSSVTDVERGCFESCLSLETVSLPPSITVLSNNTFYNCESLKQIEIPSSVTSLGKYCFRYCRNLKSVVIPSSVNTLGLGCFQGCSSMEEVDVPSSVTDIGDYCFSGCTSLVSITFPVLSANVNNIGYSCFSGCSSLAKIDIPRSVSKVGDYCFGNTPKLDSIFCYSYNPPHVDTSLGEVESKLLFVPLGCIEFYKQREGWKDFLAILSLPESQDTITCCLQFCYADGTLVPNGSVVNASSFVEDPFGGDFIPSQLYMVNLLNEKVGVQLTMTIENLSSGEVQFCLLGNCTAYHDTSSHVKKGIIGSSKIDDLMLEWFPGVVTDYGGIVFDPTAYGTTTITLHVDEVEFDDSKFSSSYGEILNYGPTITVNFIYDDPTDIDRILEKEENATSYYNLAGQRTSSLTKGINILRLSNGKTIKRFVK